VAFSHLFQPQASSHAGVPGTSGGWPGLRPGRFGSTPAQNTLLIPSTFPTFVPSLSWQIFGIFVVYRMVRKQTRALSYRAGRGCRSSAGRWDCRGQYNRGSLCLPTETHLFLNFSYVCPEPVLVKGLGFSMKWRKKTRVRAGGLETL
jgi:hypothetical protein